MMMYKYYLIGETADAEYLPKAGRIYLRMFGSRPIIPSIKVQVCGEAAYDHPLDGKVISRCHLMQVIGIIN